MANSMSRKYKAASETEQKFVDNSSRDIFPDDVKKDPSAYENQLVAWPGIAKEFILDESNENYDALLILVEHHYYDWIEDLSLEKPVNLSPEGEGTFTTVWYLKKGINYQERIKEGDLIIAYGYPKYFSESDYLVNTGEYLRLIESRFVNPAWLPYGRNGFTDIDTSTE